MYASVRLVHDLFRNMSIFVRTFSLFASSFSFYLCFLSFLILCEEKWWKLSRKFSRVMAREEKKHTKMDGRGKKSWCSSIFCEINPTPKWEWRKWAINFPSKCGSFTANCNWLILRFPPWCFNLKYWIIKSLSQYSVGSLLCFYPASFLYY